MGIMECNAKGRTGNETGDSSSVQRFKIEMEMGHSRGGSPDTFCFC